jgi:hypothetical protein
MGNGILQLIRPAHGSAQRKFFTEPVSKFPLRRKHPEAVSMRLAHFKHAGIGGSLNLPSFKPENG